MENYSNSIGSVVLCEGVKYLVIGIVFLDNNNKYVKNYIAVPLPQGYFKPESIRVINALDIELVSEGYKSELSDSFRGYLDNMDQLVEIADSETIRRSFEKINSHLKGD